jgi:hypothetical protein
VAVKRSRRVPKIEARNVPFVLRIVSGVTIVAMSARIRRPEALTDEGETPTFVVSQPHPSAMELRLQYAILFPQTFDNIPLLPFELAEQRRNDQVQRKHAEVHANAVERQLREELATLQVEVNEEKSRFRDANGVARHNALCTAGEHVVQLHCGANDSCVLTQVRGDLQPERQPALHRHRY